MKSWSLTIQMKATEQYVPVVLFIVLHKMILTFEYVDEILSVTIQIKATEQCFPVVLFIRLCKVVLTFEPVDEIHSSESYLAAHSCSSIHFKTKFWSWKYVQRVKENIKQTCLASGDIWGIHCERPYTKISRTTNGGGSKISSTSGNVMFSFLQQVQKKN